MANQETSAAERSKSKKPNSLSITPAQLRAARALLDWTRSDCARLTGLSPETIKNIEHDIFIPTQETVEKIMNALSGHGVEFFIQQGSSTLRGVALKDSLDSVDQNEGAGTDN